MHADLRGVDPGAVDIGVDNSTLTIKAELTGRSADNAQWIASQRFTGTYLRQLSLGEGVDTDHISANEENGVLSVTIPVADRAKPRRVPTETRGEIGVVEQPAASGPTPALTSTS